ncbi:MAG: tRNA adenosine(34) deaminase TadA [Syntrophobacterales bacterium]|nr:tRNA adenosine(34) deaminase TadA [Syntrophobacterales bacterium]
MNDERFMRMALGEAEKALLAGEVPVGAVVVADGEVLAAAHNSTITLNDPSAHAEILAIRRAGERLKNYRLPGTTLYVTLEPCIMCAAAILQARMARVVFGADDPKNGGVSSLYRILADRRLNHQADALGGVLREACGEILSRFFREKRVMSSPISGD